MMYEGWLSIETSVLEDESLFLADLCALRRTGKDCCLFKTARRLADKLLPVSAELHCKHNEFGRISEDRKEG